MEINWQLLYIWINLIAESVITDGFILFLWQMGLIHYFWQQLDNCPIMLSQS